MNKKRERQDEDLPYGRRRRLKPSTQKKKIPCPCAKHKGIPIRSDLWKRCEGRNMVKNIHREVQLKSLEEDACQLSNHEESNLGDQNIAGPSTSQGGAPLSLGEHFDRNDDDYDVAHQVQEDDDPYEDPTLPLLPGELSGQDIVNDEPMGDTGDRCDAESRPSWSDDGQSSSLGWSPSTDGSSTPKVHGALETFDQHDSADDHFGPPPEFPPMQVAPEERPCVDPSDLLAGDGVWHDAAEPPLRVPNHVEFFELLALQLQTQFGTPKHGIEYFLKSIKWALGPDGVIKPSQEEPPNQDEEESTHVPLSQSLETLLKRAGIESAGVRYVVCPEMLCNKMVQLSLLPRDTQSLCSDCGASLMKVHWYKHKDGYRQAFKPIVKFRFHSLIKQLTALLSRPDIVAAMREHKAHLRRPNRNADVKENITNPGPI
ncbi:hypothetical protein FRC06_001730 [Ceratobasidium sp. 370]|nr:hypothetical protein FRC06_001730 [Ceratobasidium sp. 370]